MKQILILQTRPGIGDLCIFLSSIHEIAKKNLDKEIILVTKKRTRAREILKNDKLIKKIVFIDEEIYISGNGFFSNFQKLKDFICKSCFSEAFIMHYGLRYKLACRLGGIKKIYSYPLFKKKDNISKKIYEQTKLWLNVDSYNRNANIHLVESNETKKNKIVIGIGSSGITRRWDNKKFVNVINFLNQKENFHFLIAGGKSEILNANKIISNVSKNIKIDSMCDDNIGKILNKIENSLFYFGTDSAFMHLSAAIKIKSFPLFGDTPTNYAEYSDYISPILPVGFKKVSHNSDAMQLIDDKKVCEVLEDFLKISA